ncbi:uncharacterized protein [Branchiostoma lanceolatum]|uniref:uncharacterized protein n=1 Tax=Branchiostoma lanceolatum TaxID=7740 RepID=UPI003453EDB4
MAEELVCEYYETDTQYRYRWNLPALPGSRFTFEVQANNDAHVALSSQNQDLDAMYEIVLGGWGNTQSVIRRGKQRTNLAKVSTPGINSPTEHRAFWITWSSDGTIAVGKGDETEPFMQWTDPDPLPIAYAGYSTGWGSTGRWKFCPSARPDVCEYDDTDNQYRYRWNLPPLTGSRFTFEVQANNDAHVALSSQNRDQDAMYEIVLGGWGNTQSVIRRGKQGHNHAKASTPGINSPTEYRAFWITWSSDGTIAVGKGDETEPFMQWTDPDPLPIAYAGYSTGWGSTGRWKFCPSARPDVCEYYETDTQYRYRWNLPPLTVSRFTFEVQANNDAHVALSSQNQDLDAMYEIVLGGWRNTQSVIRRSKQGNNHATVSTPGINSPTEYRAFWITWSSDGTIAVGKGDETEPFMQWTDPDPLPIAYAGYSTGWGSTGRWKFCPSARPDVCEYDETDTQYRYRWNLPPLTGSRCTFEVQANNDAHVALSSQNQDQDAMYEIVLGGWGNTQSVIRRGKQGHNHAKASTPGINSPTEHRAFWITWSSDGTIAVGKGDETEPFMQWTDPDPLPIAYAGYSTGWGSTGRWKFCPSARPDVCEYYETDTQYRYRWNLPPLTVSRFTFEVQANNDAHVALSSQNQDLDAMYEIVLGGWRNTQSVIRRSKQGNNHATVSTPGINSPTEYRAFWITWSSDGTIAVGKGDETEPFMQWTDPDPLPIAYAGYSTGWGSTGRWKFCQSVLSEGKFEL